MILAGHEILFHNQRMELHPHSCFVCCSCINCGSSFVSFSACWLVYFCSATISAGRLVYLCMLWDFESAPAAAVGLGDMVSDKPHFHLTELLKWGFPLPLCESRSMCTECLFYLAFWFPFFASLGRSFAAPPPP